jgi:hypothetical protein
MSASDWHQTRFPCPPVTYRKANGYRQYLEKKKTIITITIRRIILQKSIPVLEIEYWKFYGNGLSQERVKIVTG